MTSLIAVIDIGKTNAKLLLMNASDGSTVWRTERVSPAVPSRHAETDGLLDRELDVQGIESWLLAQLASLPDRERVRAIVPVAHGAAMVLVDGAGDVLVAPDYEDRHFDRLPAEYMTLRAPFSRRLSPSLPPGQYLGNQIFYLQHAAPALFRRTRLILTYPQYWAWRLSGVAASELTSVGCHSDLWCPIEGHFSDLAITQGWASLMPPIRPARAVLGTLRREVVAATGLSAGCAVVCGIHDSSASYLSHLVSRREGETFAVLTSGTWCVLLAHGADLGRLCEADGMLSIVDALGSPIASARFMGGREYAAIAGAAAQGVQPNSDNLGAILAAGAMALPAFAPAGPFQGARGRLLNAELLTLEGRAALATVYCALMADFILERLGVAGTILIDGPLAANPLFAPVLQSLRPADAIASGGTRSGIAAAVLWLAGEAAIPEPSAMPVAALSQAAFLRTYRDRWTSLLPSTSYRVPR
jgi:sugar (pentulose or hexulose) kinase